MQRYLSKTAIAASLLAMSSVSATAADFDLPPLADWTGFYIGGHAGYVDVSTSGERASFISTFPPATDSGAGDGGIFGGQIGYNVHAGEFLIGIEADGSLLTVDAVELELKDTYSADYDWFASVRGRMGLVHDDTLVFATGGLAFTQIKTQDFGSSNVATGFAVGGGVEHKFAPQWSGKVEYLYANFNSISDVGFDNAPDNPVFEADFHIIRAGMNFFF